MKAFMIQAALLWLAIVAEQSRTDLMPSYCLLLPCCSLCLTVRKTTSSLFVIGSALLIQDLLRMESLPVVTVGLMLACTFVASRPERDSMSRRHNLTVHRLVPDWLLMPAFIFASGTLLHFGYQAWRQSGNLNEVQSYLTVAIPVLVVSILALRISREFGFRYSMN